MNQQPKLETFEGETPTLALQKAHAKYGDRAFIVSTKEIRKKTLVQPGLYEVVAMIKDEEPQAAPTTVPQDMGQAQPQASSEPITVEQMKSLQKSAQRQLDEAEARLDNPTTPQPRPSQDKDPKEVLFDLSEAAKQISKIADVDSTMPNRYGKPIESAQAQKRNNLVDEANRLSEKRSSKDELEELRLIKGEISKLTDKVKIIQNIVWDEKEHAKGTLQIPPEFAEIYRVAKKSGMQREHLDAIMRLSFEHMPQKMKQNTDTVKRYFQTILRKMIPIRAEYEMYSGKKKIMMLVGPTGVGKTTTLAKLAARFSHLVDKKYKVGVITLDTYRIGAIEHLMTYTKMMKLGIEAVIDPPEFVSAINSLRHCDYILIDTAGSSQYDQEKISNLQKFLDADPDISIDVSLVMSAGTKIDELKDIYDNFSVLGIDNVIFTKLDESKEFGNIFSLVYNTQKPISYLSVGQDVPYDLVVANNDYIIDCLLNGFTKPQIDKKAKAK
jgi:flagellar biosynthesis protein FlhF